MNLRKRRIILGVCVAIFALAVPITLLYTAGYRIDSAFHLYKTGGLYVSSPLSGSKIFINNIEKKETNILQNWIFLQSLKPGKYSVLIAKDGYWPWAKNLQVKAKFVTEARALLIPKDTQGKVILKENYTPIEITKYDTILQELKIMKKPLTLSGKKAALPEQIKKRYSRKTANEKQELSWNPQINKLEVEWKGDKNSLPYYFCDDSGCNEKINILQSKYTIKNAEFYPNRKDIVIIAVNEGIYALEIDGRGGRLMQPIYKGKDPIFTTSKGENSVYILEENNVLVKVDLE